MRNLAAKKEAFNANSAAAIASPVPNSLDEEQSRNAAIRHCNEVFSTLTAEQRIIWSLEHLPNQHVLTSSFGAQAAVSLHLVTAFLYAGLASRPYWNNALMKVLRNEVLVIFS